MNISEKSKKHIDSCRFCWMCHHICPIGNATGLERNTAKARALGLSLVNRNALEVEEVADNIYECALCSGCANVCVTGWDPVMFTKEARLQTALDGKTPEYIQKLVKNCLESGNAYGEKKLDKKLESKIEKHSKKADTLLWLGSDARYKLPAQAVKAIEVFEKAGVEFKVEKDETESGTQLDFLIGKANETVAQMKKAAKVMSAYKTVVFFDPQDAACVKQVYAEYGVEVKAETKTFTAFVADLFEKGKLTAKKGKKTVCYQDPFQLARNLGETEPARNIIKGYAKLSEMLCVGKETFWAGNLLMAEYLPDVMEKVAKKRLDNATSLGIKTIVTSSVSEYASLKKVAGKDVSIVAIEDLIVG